MALSNVWTRDSSGEWVRTTALEAGRRFHYTASANGRLFRCYNCFQYVTFVKGDNRSSHFRHSSGYENKDCEDRSFNLGVGNSHVTMSDMVMPLRLQIEGRRLFFSIGLLSIGEAELDRCIACGMQIELQGNRGGSVIYRVDRSRFAPHMTTWLNIPASAMNGLRIVITPKREVPSFWSGETPGISASGTLFDVQTGKRIPDKGDVCVGREYLLVRREPCRFNIPSSVIAITNIAVSDVGWYVYRVRAVQFCEDASNFFFNYRVRLTNHPVEMSVLWPPLFESDEIIETGFRNLLLVVKGEGDFAPYPKDACKYENVAVHDGMHLIDLRDSGALQMVTSERYNQTLNFRYLCLMDRTIQSEEPRVEIVDDDGNSCDNARLEKVPVRGVLYLTPTDDGYVDVYEKEEFFYRKKLPAGTKTRITDLRANMCLCIRVGMELLSNLEIVPQTTNVVQQYRPKILPRWHGRMVPLPKRYAWVLDRVDADTELYIRIKSALRQGEIPQDGFYAIQKIAEDC